MWILSVCNSIQIKMSQGYPYHGNRSMNVSMLKECIYWRSSFHTRKSRKDDYLWILSLHTSSHSYMLDALPLRRLCWGQLFHWYWQRNILIPLQWCCLLLTLLLRNVWDTAGPIHMMQSRDNYKQGPLYSWYTSLL